VNYLLDTCLLSELRKPAPDAGVVSWISDIDESRLYLSVLNLEEIQKGVARLEDGRRKHAIQHWLEQDLMIRFDGRILPLTLDMALEWGLVCAASEHQGKPAPVVDALLAATAIVHNLILVTRNDKDFTRFPVKLLNPWNHS